MRNSIQAFPTIRTEGGLFPPDFLQRLAQQQGIPGLETSAYHLTEPGERLRDAINRSWARLTDAWTAFSSLRARQRDDDPGTTITRARWLLVIFQELGYGHLQGVKALEVDGKTFPVSHAWHRTPIHLVGYGIDLDRRTPGQVGAARSSPHGLVQELLNRHDDYLWGFVSNGLCLRVLRDNAALTRLAYVEFDLEAMMEGGHVSDFAVFWLLCHQSRVEGERPEECWLEKWATEAREQGQRALEQLRGGVEQAITALGAGFIAHPANAALREELRSGTLGTQDYYRQVLRLVYRLIFLFVAEDRDLLLPKDAPAGTRERYAQFYGTARLRRMAARRRGTPHPDLYQGLQVVMSALGAEEGCPPLGLKPLGSFLWSPQAVEHIGTCELANRDLLSALRALTVVERDRITSVVDWRNLGSEELGSVYESLLELHPRIDLDAGTFELSGASGSERKTTGSYYTPESLIQCLLDTALNPVLEQAAAKPDAERAILSLKVCDPACGSGHFLVAAAHRIARRLAAVRTGDEEAAPEAVQTALREVVSRCLYGVDLNEMAVELCKVSLWMEAIEPGKPLSFLDHRVVCGNSLLGATPRLLNEGIPDAAFQVLEGDDPEVVRILKGRNKRERTGQTALPLVADRPAALFGNLADSWTRVEEIADATLNGVRQKESLHRQLLRSEDYCSQRVAADAWCAAFVMPKTGRADDVVTEDAFQRIRRRSSSVEESILDAIATSAEEYRFFHWHLAFPDVFRLPIGNDERPENQETGWGGGFDVVLGNPLWERIQPEVLQFFADSHPELLLLERAARNSAIAELAASEPSVHRRWQAARRRELAQTSFMKRSGRYSCSTVKNVNSYAVFQEATLDLVSRGGRSALVLQSGIATDDNNKSLFGKLLAEHRLISLFDFENREGLFPDVDSRMRFCLVTCGAKNVDRRHPPVFVFGATNVSHLGESTRRFEMDEQDFALLAPNTGLCPTFRSNSDAELVKLMYRRSGVLARESDGYNPWTVEIRRVFSMGYDSGGFLPWGRDPTGDTEVCRVYEAKLFHQFDHRHATYVDSEKTVQAGGSGHRGRGPSDLIATRFRAPVQEVERRLRRNRWSADYLLVYRDITNATNERTCIAAFLPREATDDTIRVLFANVGARQLACLAGNLNSYALDYCARNTVASTHLAEYLAKQLPVLPPPLYSRPLAALGQEPPEEWIAHRVLELVYTATDLVGIGRDLGWHGGPFAWDESRRFALRCELDASFFHLYLGPPDEWRAQPESLTSLFPSPRDAVAYIMDTFPIVRRNDEAAHGEYRTKRVILEIYDDMAEAIRTGQPYRTRLDPPPADPRVAHPEHRS